MKKIKELYNQILKHFSLIDIVFITVILLLLFSFGGYIYQLHEVRIQKKQMIKQLKASDMIIKHQESEIKKLKIDVIYHTILADSAIAKANNFNHKQKLKTLEYEKIDSTVGTYDDADIIKFWANHKKR